MYCLKCGKSPQDISEYREEARRYGHRISPAEFVAKEEGTYDQITDTFLCTECYIAVGMPVLREIRRPAKHGNLMYM